MSAREILIIDDNEVDRTAARRALRGEFTIHEAATAREGLDAATKAEPDCVLLDYRLPDQDGLEILPTLVARGLTVIMLTGQGDEAVAVAALKAGASDYLVKDRLDGQTLSKAVDYALKTRALHAKVSDQAAELRSKEEQLFRFLDAIPLGIYVRDPSGGVYYSNRHADDLLGASLIRGERSGEGALYVAGTDDPYPLEELPTARALAGDTCSIHDAELRRADSSVRISAMATPIYDRVGSIEYVVATVQDISEVHKLEEQFRQAQKMEAVGRLAGGIAHDFNNLLTAIFSFGAFVLETLDDGSPAHEDMKEILRAATRAKQLTGQLLAFSRKQPTRPRPVNLSALVAVLEKMLARILGETISIRTDLDADLWHVKLDAGVFEQVVVNLAVNAREAMPAGGSLVIQTRNQRVEDGDQPSDEVSMAAGDYVVLTVEDTGFGMNAQTRARIFEPFFTTKGDSGTGLGLSMCYGIVKQADGYIFVDSAPGDGTKFSVYLPRTRKAAQKTDIAETPVPLSAGAESILVVEDNRLVRKLAVRSLSRQGYVVHVAEDGEAALRLCKDPELHVDLLLSDVVMPGLGGRQLADALSAERPNLKVLFMSGYDRDAIVHQGIVDESVNLLHKPFSPDRLVASVRAVLDTNLDAALPRKAETRPDAEEA